MKNIIIERYLVKGGEVDCVVPLLGRLHYLCAVC